MSPLRIASTINVQKLNHGAGFRALGLRGSDQVMDPFLMVDHYWMSEPTFGPHPHAGFSAVTYMFNDAETGFLNRDSRGDSSEIRPGDLHWTIAGAGVVHDEVPVTNGKTAHGLQIFVNLAAAKKHMPPGAIHVPHERLPVHTQAGGARVKVAFGAYDDGVTALDAVAEFPTEAALLDVRLDAGHAFHYPVAADYTAFVLIIRGAVAAGEETLNEGRAVAFERAGGEIVLRADSDSQFALFLGKPLKDPVVRHGPFAMTNQADIARAIADYQAGKMGRLD
jgi:redox-sensitive bicupin YhaK (pirin superfamily)